jgi:hypothetical protein
MSINSKKIPIFSIQYHEFGTKVEGPIEIRQLPLCIDGYFDSCLSNRFCLGYLVNLNRKPESERILQSVALGIEFDLDNQNVFFVKSYTQQPVFIKLKTSDEQIQLNPGKLFYFHVFLFFRTNIIIFVKAKKKNSLIYHLFSDSEFCQKN